MRLLTAHSRDLPSGRVSADTLERLYRFPRTQWLRANFVSTLDGAAHGADGVSGSINTEADHTVFALNRRLADAILVGAGTARTENYRPARQPLIVVSRRGRLPDALQQPREGRVILATCEGSGRVARENVWLCGRDTVDLAHVVARAQDEGYGRLLCEGGPGLFADLLEAGLVDEVALTTSPILVGGNGIRINSGRDTATQAHLRHLLESDGTLLALWRLTKK